MPDFAGVNYGDRIVIDPVVRSGKPAIRGTRIAAADGEPSEAAPFNQMHSPHR